MQEKRQQQTFRFTILRGVGENGESFLADGDENRIVALTGFMTSKIDISPFQTIDYSSGTDTVQIMGPGQDQQLSGIKTFSQFFMEVVDLEEFTDQDPPRIERRNGCIYRDDCTAFFMDSREIIDFIERSRSSFPLTDVEVNVVSRSEESIQLNIDETPDGVINEEEDDVLNLRGSAEVDLSSLESIGYTDEILTIFRHPNTPIDVFENVDELRVLESVIRDGEEGIISMTFVENAPRRFEGPGTLFVGMNTAGETVATYTDSDDLGEEINERINEEQLFIVSMPMSTDIFSVSQTTTPILQVEDGTNQFVIMSVAKVTYSNGIVMLFDRDNNPIPGEQFGLTGQTFTLSTFFNNSLETVSGSGMRTYCLLEDGINLIVNPMDGTIFAYPLSETALQAGIQDAIGTRMAFDLTFQRNELGQGEFCVNGDTVLSDDHRVFVVPSDTTTTLNNGLITAPVANGNFRSPTSTTSSIRTDPLAGSENLVSAPFFEMHPNNTNVTIPGGGNMYLDSDMRALFVADEADSVQDFIEFSLAEPQPAFPVNVVGEMVNGTTQVYLESAGIRLLDITNADKAASRDDQRLVYLDGTISFADASMVPLDSQVLYDPQQDVVQVIEMGKVVQTKSANGQFFTRSLTGFDIEMIDSTGGNMTFMGGGVLYCGQNGIAYLPFDILDMTACDALNQIGALTRVAEGVNELFFYPEGNVDSYRYTLQESRPGGGMLYVSGDTAFYTTDESLIMEIPEQVSHLIPVELSADATRSMVSLSRGGSELYTFDSRAMVFDSMERDMLEYSDGNLQAPTVFPGTFMNIEMLTTYDGCSTVRLNSSARDFEFSGEGCLIVDEQAGTSFFTSDRLTTDRIKQFLSNLFTTFAGPQVVTSQPATFTSTQSQVNAGFGQIVEIYEGANIDLECTASNANPPSSFSFFVRNLTTNSSFTQLMESENVAFVTNGANNVTLRLMNVMVSSEYMCSASNAVGRDTETTRVSIRSRGECSLQCTM